ncbi:DNA polymerase subunit Cdc27 family protein [Candida albicans]|uniref:DNA polymerase delta subunit 3 n=1 Tax=Candida albicans TaxID=5476 RepID=A0A8H6BVU0_CANAX|nr:DNA polymerase subunit Cdc27 family protein [Candida albicans]
MSSSADEIEYLATEIITNSKPVSYHKFSRQLNIHVSKAKATLLEYYQKNKNDLTATFIVTGRNDNGKLIKLSNEDDLESDLKKFTTVHCVHVRIETPSSLNKISEYEKNGIIIGPKIEKAIPVNIPSSPVKPEPSHKNKPTEEKKSSSSLLSSYVSRKQEKKQQDTRSGTLSNYVSRKTEPTIPSKRSNTEPATKPTYQYKSRKLEAKAPKERVIIAENNDNEDEEDDDDDKPIKASRARIHQIFRGCLMVTILLLEEQQSKEANPENEPGLFVNEEEEEEEEQKEQEETPSENKKNLLSKKMKKDILLQEK